MHSDTNDELPFPPLPFNRVKNEIIENEFAGWAGLRRERGNRVISARARVETRASTRRRDALLCCTLGICRRANGDFLVLTKTRSGRRRRYADPLAWVMLPALELGGRGLAKASPAGGDLSECLPLLDLWPPPFMSCAFTPRKPG